MLSLRPENGICEMPVESQFGVILLILIVEMWLGRTNKVQAASILDLIRNMLIPPQAAQPQPQAPAQTEEKKDGT